eukprot:COSAG02_NODE_663_length_18741_cov_9.083682_18_plen_40_part_00
MRGLLLLLLLPPIQSPFDRGDEVKHQVQRGGRGRSPEAC